MDDIVDPHVAKSRSRCQISSIQHHSPPTAGERKQVWREWLELHVPDRAAHVMSLLQQMRGGKDYDSRFGTRMRGEGPFADLIAMRFAKARKRLGFPGLPPLRSDLFVPPKIDTPQGDLF